jgi:hypothetical protein
MYVFTQDYSLLYISPGIKLSFPISNIWFTATYSQEYIRFFGKHLEPFNDVIDHRIDIGLKFYKDNLSTEIYYPLRLDEEVVEWYYGGIVFGVNYRF